MTFSRTKGRERPHVPSLQGPCASKPSISSQRTSSSENSAPRTSGLSTLRWRPHAKASNKNGGFGSRTTSSHGTSRRSANMHMTQLELQGDRGSRKASSPPSIPLSLNYFDVLLEEEEEGTGGEAKCSKKEEAKSGIGKCGSRSRREP